MRTDHTTYQTATRVSAAGLALQLIIGLVIFLFGLATHDNVAYAVGLYMFMGLPVWLTLVLLFHQHRLERIEAIEAEQIESQTERSSSIFNATDSDLNMAARRLRWMHQFLVPAMSIVTAIGLLVLGYWQWGYLTRRVGSEATTSLGMVSKGAAPWGLAITAFVAIGCFIFSRYVSGMSHQKAWRNLRAGATVIVGSALAAGALAVAFALKIVGKDSGLEILAYVVPLFVGLGGAEIAVNFVLNLYRPRQAGEFPRPAFDSRILNLVAAPDNVAKSISDTINYQFGFEVTSTWAYRLLARSLWALAAFCFVVYIALSCASIVRPDEQAIITSFGRLARDGQVYPSGPVFKWPWESVEAHPVFQVQRIRIGKEISDPKGAILWDGSHTTVPEDLVIVGPTRMLDSSSEGETPDGQADQVARSFSLLNLEVPIQYRIKEGKDNNGEYGLLNYVNFISGQERNRKDYILALATRVITQRTASLSIDDVLGSMRSNLAYDLKTLLQVELDRQNAGIEVIFVGVSGIHPPKDVAPTFEEVLKAREIREAALQAANGEAIRQLATVAGSEEKARRIAREIETLENMVNDGVATTDPEFMTRTEELERLLVEAGGDAAKTLLQAQADRWVVHMDAWARYIQQDSQYAAYEASPELYMAREYLQRMSAALAKTRLFITSPGVNNDVVVELLDNNMSLSGMTVEG